MNSSGIECNRSGDVKAKGEGVLRFGLIPEPFEVSPVLALVAAAEEFDHGFDVRVDAVHRIEFGHGLGEGFLATVEQSPTDLVQRFNISFAEACPTKADLVEGTD